MAATAIPAGQAPDVAMKGACTTAAPASLSRLLSLTPALPRSVSAIFFRHSSRALRSEASQTSSLGSRLIHECLRRVIGARAENRTVVATIFVNPRQFSQAQDFTKYPRDEARDVAICAEEGVDIVWAPPADEVYVPGFDTTVSVGAIA